MEKRTSPTSQIQPVMYCNNCGGRGHLFKTCRDPILSCGILLLDKPSLPISANVTRILMIRRKDSMSFAEFMRGKYDPTNEEYVSLLIANMTLKEQAALASDPFDVLWRSLWGEDRTSSDYAPSRDKFNQLDKLRLVQSNISSYTEPEWGFPKGRRMRGESDLSCALREFDEETNIPRDSFIVLKNIVLEETFMGLNGIRYRHVYYVAVLKQPEMINLNQKFTHMQRREISGIAWKSFAEVEAHIRPHHVERQGMIDQLRSIIDTFESE